MTFDDLLCAATQPGKAEGMINIPQIRSEAMARYLHRLEHVLNLIAAIELKEAELAKLRELRTEATATLEERAHVGIEGLTEQLRRYLTEPCRR